MIPLLFKWSFGRISQVLNRTGAASLAPFPDLCSADSTSLNMMRSGSVLYDFSLITQVVSVSPDVPNPQLL